MAQAYLTQAIEEVAIRTVMQGRKLRVGWFQDILFRLVNPYDWVLSYPLVALVEIED